MTDAALSSRPAAKAPNWRRRCLRALPVVILLGLAVQLRDTVPTWLRDNEFFVQEVPFDRPATLAGAEWRVVSLQRVAERRDGSAVALLRMEAKVLDAETVAAPPCRIALTDPEGRRWQSTFLPPSEASRLRSTSRRASRLSFPTGRPRLSSSRSSRFVNVVLPVAACSRSSLHKILPGTPLIT